MLQLLIMKDPMQGISSGEFIGRCRINADIGLISANSGPDVPSALAEGDGRHPIFSRQQTGSAEGVVDHVHRQSSVIGQKPPFPGGISRRRNISQEEGDQVFFVGFPVRPASFARFAIARQGCIECRSPTVIKVHGMDGYAPAILRYIYSHLVIS
jgi:hypothetical protein